MFAVEPLQEIIESHKKAFQDLAKVEQELNKRFYDMEDPIQALILSVATGGGVYVVNW